MADAGFPRRLVFKGVIEFPLIIEVAGHRIEKQGRLIYEMTPDGLYFDPVKKRDVNGLNSCSLALEVESSMEGWLGVPYGILDGPNAEEASVIDVYLAELMEADGKRQSDEARLAHAQDQASKSPKH